MNGGAHLLGGKKIWLHSLGCRTNQAELEAIASGLADAGTIFSDTPNDCSAAVILTCSVTAKADKKSRQCVRMTRREMPAGTIIACGCWAQRLSQEEARELGIDFVVANGEKGKVIKILGGELQKSWDSLPRLKNLTLRSRAFVKIQDGCDHFCSYCIVPFLRGAPVSRPFDDVFAEISSIATIECEEIILTGTNLGKYNSGGRKLEDIVREFAKFPQSVASVPQLRLQFGSIEPFSLDEGLLKAISELGKNFVPPLHIPLQSGDDEVLRLMRRGYTSGQYLEKIAQVREILGDIPLNTDLLIGFPGESDAAFERSRALLRKIGYSKVHVFPFSPREGTVANSLPNQVPREIISARARIIRDENPTRN